MTFMSDQDHGFLSEMTVDLRDEKTRQRTKYNDPIDSLNPTVQALKRDPEFVSRTEI